MGFCFDYFTKCSITINVSLAEASADDHMDSGTANDKSTSAGDDVEQHDGGRRSGVEEAVVHERRGAYGGSDLHKKPPNTTSSGATNLPLINLACCFCVCFLIASFTLG